MELRQLLLFLSALLLSSCSIFKVIEDTENQRFKAKQDASILGLFSAELLNVKAPKNKPVIAVYPNSFTDQTGQRKSNSEFALFSTALTQAPQALLIRALKHTSKGNFFIVVERVGLDNLTKERQLIRSTRETENEKKLKPLLFAGIIIEGAVLAYDSNLKTGGIGARYLGIGSSIEYRQDAVTVSLRLVSVLTGEILVEVLSEKTIYSYGQTQDVFKFYELNTELVELEFGNAANESPTIALQKAIESAILEIVNIGYERRFWTYE